jgi:nicotinate phosphoribosyltransferase
VCRTRDADGRLLRDRVQLASEPCAGEALLQPVLRDGRRIASPPTLEQSRERCAAQLRSLPAPLRSLEAARQPFVAEISESLHALAREVDAATAA